MSSTLISYILLYRKRTHLLDISLGLENVCLTQRRYSQHSLALSHQTCYFLKPLPVHHKFITTKITSKTFSPPRLSLRENSIKIAFHFRGFLPQGRPTHGRRPASSLVNLKGHSGQALTTLESLGRTIREFER